MNGMKLFLLALVASAGAKEEAARVLRKEKTDEFVLANTVEDQLKCNSEILITYGLKGMEKAKVAPHSLCPKITHNCCSEEDQLTSLNLWKNDFQFRVENYYEVYIYALKYLLGFTNEVFLLAQSQEKSNFQECRYAATDLLAMNFNPKIALEVLNTYIIATRKVAEIRKGFYCIICDAKTQDKLKDFWASTNLFSRNRIYFSRDFCKQLVDEHIYQSFYTAFYLKRYLDNMSTLVRCKVSEAPNLRYDLPMQTAQQIKNCYYFKHRYFFFFCEKYCENFQLSRFSTVFDGDVKQLRPFVEMLAKHRHAAFAYPNNNLLVDSVIYEETYLLHNFEEATKDPVFLKPILQQVMLDKFDADFVYYGGVSAMVPAEANTFPLMYDAVGVLRMVWGLLLALALVAGM